MAGVKLYNKTGDEKAVRTQEAIEKKFGFIPEVFQAMGRNGDFLQAAMHIADVAGQGLDAKTRELIIIADKAGNGCAYCLDAHRSAALAAGVTDEEITAAIEVAASISLYNNFNKAISLNSDLKTR